mmetsp:Transcript_18986/g.34449  ORF Transcript_18986/g.34449 Transcript_18986/m.34449 type:complete len:203 (+) Transcript_18986:1471-2079(+)
MPIDLPRTSHQLSRVFANKASMIARRRKLAERLRELFDAGSSVHLVSSPFLRCLEAAAPIASVFYVPIHIEEFFGEWRKSRMFDECPFDSLPHKAKSAENMLRITSGQDWIVNEFSLSPSFTESLDEGYDRFMRAFNEYIPKVQEDVLIIVSHSLLTEVIGSIYGRKSMNLKNKAFCMMSQLKKSGRGFSLVLDGGYTHGPQ